MELEQNIMSRHRTGGYRSQTNLPQVGLPGTYVLWRVFNFGGESRFADSLGILSLSIEGHIPPYIESTLHLCLPALEITLAHNAWFYSKDLMYLGPGEPCSHSKFARKECRSGDDMTRIGPATHNKSENGWHMSHSTLLS